MSYSALPLLKTHLITLLLIVAQVSKTLQASEWKLEEIKRFKAEEAHQGVAVDAAFFYAITNEAIGKYRKDTGDKVGE